MGRLKQKESLKSLEEGEPPASRGRGYFKVGSVNRVEIEGEYVRWLVKPARHTPVQKQGP